VLDRYPGHELEFAMDFFRRWRHRILPLRRTAYCEPVCSTRFVGHHAFEDYPLLPPVDGPDLLCPEDLARALARARHEQITRSEASALRWFYEACPNGGCLCFHDGLSPDEQCYKGGLVNAETAIYRKRMCLRPGIRIMQNVMMPGEFRVEVVSGPEQEFPPVLSQKNLFLGIEEGAKEGSPALPGQKTKSRKKKRKKRKGKKQQQQQEHRQNETEEEDEGEGNEPGKEQQKGQEGENDENERRDLGQPSVHGSGASDFRDCAML